MVMYFLNFYIFNFVFKLLVLSFGVVLREERVVLKMFNGKIVGIYIGRLNL